MLGEYQLLLDQLSPAPKGQYWAFDPATGRPALLGTPEPSSGQTLGGLLLLGGAIALLVWGFGGSIRANPRRNVAAGFYDDVGVFHPIRASYDYSPARAGEKSRGKSKRGGRHKSKRR